MGLDMYIFSSNIEYSKDFTQEEIESMAEEYYWRKANQIFGWFDKKIDGGIENCEYHKISKEMIEELVSDLSVAIKEKDEKKFPTNEGFFFGNYEYDEWYWKELEHTLEGMMLVLSQWKDNEYYYFHAWW